MTDERTEETTMPDGSFPVAELNSGYTPVVIDTAWFTPIEVPEELPKVPPPALMPLPVDGIRGC